MKHIFLPLVILFILMGANSAMSQSQETRLIKTNQEYYIFKDLVKLINEQTGLNATYPNKDKLVTKKIYLGKDAYALKVILDKICLQLQLKYKIIGKQIAFKIIPPQKITISGYIKDKRNGEDLVGATCYINELKSGTVTNPYGFYSLTVPSGVYTLTFSFLGTKPITKQMEISQNTKLNIELEHDNQQIKEVVVKGESAAKNVEQAEMSVIKIPATTVKKLPALMGEVDLIKVVQMLPGVKPAGEGSSGFSVRGGNPDQNLLLLDEAPVYNPSHLLGFFSVFNNDAISSLKLYKGDMPASMGGRLASFLDIRMKNGNSKKFSGNGGIGSISSRLTLEGPIGKNEKTSFMVAGRRSYADLFLRLSADEEIKNNIVYFYDVNAKINHRFNDKNRLFISTYLGKDIFRNEGNEINYGNKTFSLRWNHLFSNKLFSNTTLLYSKYNYNISQKSGADAFKWISNMEDYSAKLDFNYFLNANNNIKFGALFTIHQFAPGNVRGIGSQSFIGRYDLAETNAYEQAIYLSNEQNIGEKLTLKYGIRFSMFNNVGEGTVSDYNEDYQLINTKNYKKGDIFNTYTNWEPRMGLKYTLTPSSSVKMSYSRTSQYMQLAQNSRGGFPLDIWFPSSPNVKPQVADQFAIGYFKNFCKNTIEMSLETYYKKMKNTIDFKDFANLLLNKNLEGELRFGKGEAYGVEFMTKLNFNRLQGWLGYTWAKTERTIKDINNNKAYRSPYDVPNDFKAAISYALNKRTTLSANFTYSTGAPITYPVGRAEYQGSLLKIYPDRNSYSMPDNHRLDLAVTVKNKKKAGRKWEGEWSFSLYNAYGRKNPWFVTFTQDEDNPKVIKAQKTFLFTFVPSATYNFKF